MKLNRFQMHRKLIILGMVAVAHFAVTADVIKIDTSGHSSTTLTSPTTYLANSGVFTYYGFPATNYPAAGGSTVSSIGISSSNELAKFPPVQVSFDLTGTNFELIVDSYDYANKSPNISWFTLTDGTTTTAYTNVPYMYYVGTPRYYVPISFASNTTHHLVLSLKGNFCGVNVAAGNSISSHPLTKPNLLIVEGDSYTEGYNPTLLVYGFNSYWFDGWVWQLAHLLPNTVAVPCGIGGTGFISSNGGTSPTYGQRVVADICTLYTNAVNSGKYNQIFITASGTINDLGADTNALYAAATSVYSILKNNCPQAHLFFVGNWLGAGGRTSPQADDLNNDATLSRAAGAVGVPYFSPVQANIRNASNYDLFFPPGNTDSVHPSAAGYALMAQWVNNCLTGAFGTNWDASSQNGGGVLYYHLTVNNGSGSGTYTNGQVVNIAATNIFGYYFTNWSGPGIASSDLASTTLVMPASNVVVSANLVLVPTKSSFSITDYGAVGDAVQLTVQTTSNSPVVSVIGTNRFSSADIGKVIEVFRAGSWLHLSNNIANPVMVTNQDTICLITNVTNGTNLWCAIPQGWTKQAYCIIGSNNRQAFQSAIDAAESYVGVTNQNVTINIPNGRYLIVGPKALDPNYVMHLFDNDVALTISSGGLTLKGESTNAVLLGCGAGMNHVFNDNTVYGGYGHFNPLRGTLMQCQGPITNSQYPLVFQNLTFDGGLTNGLQNYSYFTIMEANGDGWDTSHDAFLDVNPNWANQQMNQTKVFTNCVFQHWRGEILKNVTSNPGGTNTFIDIANCIFDDGNASANNLYFGQHVHGCTFSRLVKVAEYYQANTTLPILYENNVWTNIASNPLSIVGSTTNVNPPSFTVRNNVLAAPTGVNQIHFAPAENVFVISNVFYGGANGVVFSGVGVQPSDGSASIISNVVIACNVFNDTPAPITMDGYPVSTVLVSNNVYTASGTFAAALGGWKTNIVFVKNTAPGGPVDSRGVQAGSYFIDGPDNQFGTLLWDNGAYASTTSISYGGGRYHNIQYTTGKFYLDDAHASLMPPGAQLIVTNSSTGNATIYRTASLNGTPDILPTAKAISYYWANGSWNLGATLAKPSSPTGLQVIP